MTSNHRFRPASLLAAAALLAMAPALLAQGVANPESEPNNTLPDASIPASGGQGMRDTDYIVGTSSGNDADWFRVITAQQNARGIYRCTLALTSSGTTPSSVLDLMTSPTDHITIGGTSISDGVVGSTWYTFGSQTSVNYRIGFGSGPYRSTLSVTPVQVTPIATPAVAGPITIAMPPAPGLRNDRQIVVYRSNFTAMPGYTGAAVGTGEPALQRNFDPGVYYIGVCTGHMFNENPPPADSHAIGWFTPFVDTLMCDYPFTSNPRPLNFSVAHAGGQFLVPASVSERYGVAWHQLTVVPAVSNDTCEGATQIYTSLTLAGESTTLALANDGTQTCNGPAIETPGVWYQFSGSGHTMTVGVNPVGQFNPRIHLYCARNGCADLTCVGSSDSSPRGVIELASVCTDPGALYKVLVSGSTSGLDAPTGFFTVTLADDNVPCDSAVVCSPRGACSVGGVCQILSADACTQRGGSFCGENTSCDAEGVYAVASNPGFDTGELIGSGDGFFLLGDDVSASVSLPFAFPFYGVPKTIVTISSNGYLTFDAANTTAYQNTPIPDASGPNNAIYGLWQDLVSPVVGYQTRGTAPNRRFIVEYNHVSHFQGNDPNNTFQIVLFENGNIEMRYADLTLPISRSATVGVENAAGTSATSFPASQFDGFFRTLTFTYQPGTPTCMPPCAADFNHDGFVDPDDLSDYIACYFGLPACDRADYNRDGFVDPDDLSDYIAVFFGGC